MVRRCVAHEASRCCVKCWCGGGSGGGVGGDGFMDGHGLAACMGSQLASRHRDCLGWLPPGLAVQLVRWTDVLSAVATKGCGWYCFCEGKQGVPTQLCARIYDDKHSGFEPYQPTSVPQASACAASCPTLTCCIERNNGLVWGCWMLGRVWCAAHPSGAVC